MNISEIRQKFPQYNDLPDEQLVMGIHRKFYSDMPFKDFHKNITYDKAPDPTSGMNFGEKFNAGMGKAFSDLGRGAAQMVGMGPSAEDVRETNKLDAPLMNTGAGMGGNVSGYIAALAPLSRIPGANTVGGAAATGALAGALQPTETQGERVGNMALGGALSGGTQALMGPVAQKLGERAAGKQADLARQQSQNAVRDETIRMGHEAGYVVPPSAVNQPSFIGGRMESLGGKAALGQEASLRNQEVTNRLAREAASLKPDQPLNLTNMRQARFDLAAPHREIAALNPRAASDLESLQQARFDSKMAWKEYNRQGNRAAFADAVKAGDEVKRLEQSLESYATKAGRADLVQALKDARKGIAQNRQVQDALNRGTGDIEASVIGRALDNGAPLSGPLETIGRYQQAFPQYTREASKVPTPGVGKTELLASALLGGGGFAAGGPMGTLAALGPFLSGPARSALLSKPVQESVANPSYSTGPLTRGMAQLANPDTREKAALAARMLMLPAISQAVNQ